MITELKGRRLGDLPFGRGHEDEQAGDFWKLLNDDGTPKQSKESSNLTGRCWAVMVPMSYGYAIRELTMRTVREHEDGSISVLPNDGSSNSIGATGHGDEYWHGYIYNGIWRAC